jgi:tetrahydromethanopterin S-methyltransferase subunit G
MAVMVPRETVIEHRLDALEKKIDEGFAASKAEMKKRFGDVDGRFGDVDRRFGEVDRRFGEVDRRFGEVNARLDEVNERLMRLEDGFFALNRNLNAGLFVIVATLIGSNFF